MTAIEKMNRKTHACQKSTDQAGTKRSTPNIITNCASPNNVFLVKSVVPLSMCLNYSYRDYRTHIEIVGLPP
jgi:hypothetical protein